MKKGIWFLFILCVLGFAAYAQDGSATDFSTARPKPLKFSIRIFLLSEPPQGVEYEDNDFDCIRDEAEHAIADYFRPYFIFDSEENALNHNEPVVIYQVTPASPKVRRDPSETYCSQRPTRIEVRYAYLFVNDGGYGSSSWCSNSHVGDNQVLTVWVWPSLDGKKLSLHMMQNGADRWQPDRLGSAQFYQDSHPVAYLSAGKHHPYFSTWNDGGDSTMSDWGCNDDVDGLGARVFPVVESHNAPRWRHNVGERQAHPAEHFVGILEDFGFPDEHAWGEEPFCGGQRPQGVDCDETSPMKNLWR
ncbi:MAG: hypothetical protein HY747_05760 [Elusimicrobia bacterium]|nr:hypothetical protein [Elusimicrobiota bacterium]